MFLRLLAAACVAIHITACTTLTPVYSGSNRLESTLRVGDEIVLTDNAGRVHQLTIATLSPEQVCDARVCVRVGDIAVVEKREFSAAKTTTLVVTIVAIAALWAYAAALGGLMSWQ